MTQPTVQWHPMYGKQQAFLYGSDGSPTDWTALNVDSDGKLCVKGQVWQADTLSFVNLQVDADGHLKVAGNDLTSRYKISDIASPYFGYLDADGAWYIMKLSAGEARYVKGATGYAAAWAGKAGLSYDYYNETF